MSGVRQTQRSAEAAKRSPAPPARRAPVARRPAYLQSKMAVSRPGDSQEREADQVATQVARSPRAENLQRAGLAPGPQQEEQTLAPAPVAAARHIHRQEGGEEEPLQTRLQRQEEEEAVQTRLMRQAAEEEEPVQAARLQRQAMDEEQPLQTRLARQAADEEEPIQASLLRQAAQEEESLQTRLMPKGDPVAGQTLDPETEQRIESQRGTGQPLAEDVRADMDARFGEDFSAVQIHTDAEAADLAAKLGARAFTVGRDIFFAAGEYAPETDAGRELLAHELTHVVQQGTGLARRVFRQDGNGGGGTPAASPYRVTAGDYAGSTIDPGGSRMEISALSLPDFKGRRHRDKFAAPMQVAPRGATDQVNKWRTDVRSDARGQLERLARQARERGGENDSGIVFFQAREREEFLLFGTEEQLQPYFEIPIWDRSKEGRSFQVDHIQERQLGGDDDTGNYELLDASANMSAGSKLGHEIRRRIQGALGALREENPGNTNIPRPYRWQYVKNNYTVSFTDFDFGLEDFSGNPSQYWLLEDIHEGRHSRLLRPLRERELERLGQQGRLLFFASEAGGERMPIPRRKPLRNWIPRVDYLDWVPNEAAANSGDTAGTLHVDVFKSATGRRRAAGVEVDPDYESQEWGVRQVDGIYGGVINRDDVANGIRQSLRLPGMSPIALDTVSLSASGIHGEGRILPTVPLIGEADIRIVVAGDEVQLRKTFETGEINVPAPFEISESSLTVFFGSASGLGIEGEALFRIQGLGEGSLGAAASTEGGFALDGEFDFDTQLFDPARVEISYRDEQLSVSGEIGIPRGKVPGIASATVTANYTEGEGFTATGEATLDIPGVEQGTLTVSQSEEEGFSIGGTFQLSGDIPGIRGGSIEATLRERPNGEGYSVSASGEAQPDIPGFDSTLAIRYQDGAITLEATAAYQRGLLSGQVRFGATNRTLDAEGNPTGEPGDSLIAYGGGEVTLQIAPWLQGTAGIEFAPDGEVTVAGEIGLPDQIEIFPRREIRKDILSIDIPIPIVPGIFAEVGGGLDAHAGIGPGVIDQLRLGVEYTPSREEDTRVTGDAHLNVPADAGLRLSVRAGIGLGIPAASVSGGLEIGGELGLEGAAEAGVHIDWMPSTGLEIDAFGRLSAQPRFTFDVAGFVEVEALFFTIYEERWELASYELGSNLTFGVRFPIHYKQGEPFDISLDDVEFEVPDVNPRRILGDLMDAIA